MVPNSGTENGPEFGTEMRERSRGSPSPPFPNIGNCMSFWAAPSASVCFGLPAQVNQLEGTKVRERLFRAVNSPKNKKIRRQSMAIVDAKCK